jgi:tRNA(Ile)-lysidine synthase TilS/MesJ
MKIDCEAEVNLLWSGGWDSTFRLLYLVFIEKKRVQPFYIIDVNRDSTLHELRAMHAVREEVAKKNPQLANLIRPTIIVSIDDIKPDSEVTAKFNRLNESLPKPIGPQYEWLARFAKQYNIPNFELCIELSERAPNILVNLLSKHVNGDSGIMHFNENDDASIFSYFKFPLLKTSKSDMKRIATEKGFLDMLEKTWFCHKPWHNKPCGICGPCEIAIKELGYRVPKISRLRRKIWVVIGFVVKIAKSIKRLLKNMFVKTNYE